MSRRKQQNPKPLVALKQAEDEADKPSGCEAGSMTQGELLEDEVAGVERDGGLSLGRTEPCCYGSGGGGGSGDDPPGAADSPLAAADVSEADGETDTTVVHDADTPTGSQGSSARSFATDARLSSAVDRMAAAEAEDEEEDDAQTTTAAEVDAPPQEIIKVVRLDDDGEYRVLSRAYVPAGSGCGPFRARHVPTELADELCRQQPAIAEGLEARLLKFCQGDVMHWYLLEADDGRWLRFLDSPSRCRQAANVAIHYVGYALWLEVTQPLEPNDRLVAELSADSGGSCYTAAAAAVAAAAAASPRRSVADDHHHDGLRSEEASRALRATPAAASAAVRLSLDAQADGDDSMAASDGRTDQRRQEPGDRERDAHNHDGLAPSTATQHSDSSSVAADTGSRAKQFVTAAVSLSCRTCGVTFRSQRTLEAHQLYYCNQTASGVGAAAATAAPPAATAPSRSDSPARVTSACSARSGGGSIADVKPHLPPLPSTLLQHVPTARDLQPDGNRDGSMSSAIGVFRCQLCPHQTSSWPEMCAHVRDHAHIMHQVPLPAALRCIDSDSSVTEAAIVAAAAATFRRPDKRPSVLLSADSYCANCDIQFMSAASYDAHRQHYCGSRRGRLPAPVDGRNDGAATEASTAASSQPPLPPPAIGQLSAQASEQATLLLSLSRSSSFGYLPSAPTTTTSTTVAATASVYDAGADVANATKDRAAASAAAAPATGHSARARAVAEFPAARAAVAPSLPAKASKGSALLSAHLVSSPMPRTDAAGDRDLLLLSPAATAAASVARTSVDSSSGGTGRRGRSPQLQTAAAAAAAATPPLQHALTSYSFRPTADSEEGADDGDGGGNGSRHVELTTTASSLTISIPAVLSVPTPLVDGSIVCGDRGSLPGRLIIGTLRSHSSAAATASDAPDVTSLPLEVPASIIQRAMAASQHPMSLLHSTARQGSVTAAAAVTAVVAAPAAPVLSDALSPEVSQAGQPFPPISGQCRLSSGSSSRSRSGSAAGNSSGREAPLDLSMKYLKRKLPLPAPDADDELHGERVPAKILAAAYDPISLSMAAAAPASAAAGLVACGSSLTPVRAPAPGRGNLIAPHAVQVPTPAALLSKCVDCNILFYKHENYVAHKTHYCPARHRELSQVAIAAASRLDRAACWGDAGGSASSSSSSSSMADKYTAAPPNAAVAATTPSTGRMQPAVAAGTVPDSVDEEATMAAVGLSHAANSAAIGEAAAAAEQRPAAASPTAPASDDVSRDGSAADEQASQPAAAVAADDRLVITYTCNKCERSFAALDHFGKHACSTAAAAGSTATGPAAALGASPLLLFAPNLRSGDADASPRVAASSRPCYDRSAVADAAAAGESTSALIGALRRCGGAGAAAAPIGSGAGSSGGAVTTASSSAFVCSLCGYHGNTVRGMRLHGRYHIDRGEPWSEACIMDNGQRAGCGGGSSATSLATHLPSAAAAAGVLACGASSPLAGLLHLQQQQQSPYIEEELLRLKNEPYKKRKSRKSYQLFCAATAAAAAATVAAGGHSGTTTPPAAVGMPASCSDGENASATAAAITPVSAIDVATLTKFLVAARTVGTGARLGLSDEPCCPLPQPAASSVEQPSPRGCSTRIAIEGAPTLGTGAAADDALATGSPPASGERSRASSSSASRLSPAAVSPLPLKPLNGTVQQLINAHDSIATAIPAANVVAFSEEAKVARARALTPSTAADAGTPVAPTKVKMEPMADDVSPDALSAIGIVNSGNDGNSENRRSLSTPRRHVCSHCNIGFMYPTSFDAHVKFYCPSSRTASGVTATGN